MKVKLNDVIEAIDFADPEMQYFYSIETEEVLLVWDGMVNGKTNPGLIEEIEESIGEYIALPGQYDIDEYSIMEEFVDNLPGGRKREELYDALQGRGAFRRFKDELYELGLEQKWYKYRDQAYEKLARKWCEEHGIQIIK